MRGRQFETEPEHGWLPVVPTKVLRRIVDVVFSVDWFRIFVNNITSKNLQSGEKRWNAVATVK
jgi:hypothetical protein